MRTVAKHLFVSLLVLLVCSCQNNDKPAPVPPADRSYTIICYISCGNLDLDVDSMIKELCHVDVPKHINILGIVKWTEQYVSNMSDGTGGVTRFKYNHGLHNITRWSHDDKRFCVGDPENIAEVVTWAKEESPADEYIILFFGHGISYNPMFDAITRGTLYDPYYRTYAGVETIAKGLASSDTHFSLTILNSCLMNTMEYITELAPYTDYLLASSHVAYTNTQELKLLVEGLMEYGNNEGSAIEQSVDYDISKEFELYLDDPQCVTDKMLSKSSAVAHFNAEICTFVDIVASLYNEENEIGQEAFVAKYNFTTADIDEALATSYYFHGVFCEAENNETSSGDPFYSFDIVDVVSRVAADTAHPDLLATAESIVEAANSMVVCYESCFVKGVDRVYPSVTLVNAEQWNELGFGEACYEDLAFDMATGWSRLLQLNNAAYPHSI